MILIETFHSLSQYETFQLIIDNTTNIFLNNFLSKRPLLYIKQIAKKERKNFLPYIKQIRAIT